MHFLAAYLDGSLGVATAMARSHLVVNDSSLLMRAEAEEGTMPTQVNENARLYTQLMCRNHGP